MQRAILTSNTRRATADDELNESTRERVLNADIMRQGVLRRIRELRAKLFAHQLQERFNTMTQAVVYLTNLYNGRQLNQPKSSTIQPVDVNSVISVSVAETDVTKSLVYGGPPILPVPTFDDIVDTRGEI